MFPNPLNLIWSWILNRYAKARGYKVLANGVEHSKRMELCEICPYNDDGICTKCSCLIYAKAALNTERCPAKQWGRIWEKNAAH